MTRFELITKCPENLAAFITCESGGECPPEPWPCQVDVDNDHCKTCAECWRLWLVAEAEGED